MLNIVNRLVLQWFSFLICSSCNSVERFGHFVFFCLLLHVAQSCLLLERVACLFFIFSHYGWCEKVMSKVWNGLFARFIGCCCCFCCCCSWSRLAAVGLQSCSVRLPWWISWGLTWSFYSSQQQFVWIGYHSMKHTNRRAWILILFSIDCTGGQSKFKFRGAKIFSTALQYSEKALPIVCLSKSLQLCLSWVITRSLRQALDCS